MAAATIHVSDDFLFDVRLQARHVRAGLVGASQLQAHLAALPDKRAEAETTDVEQLLQTLYARRQRAQNNDSR